MDDGWSSMRRRELLRVYHRFKREGHDVKWTPSKDKLARNLKRAWQRSGSVLPDEVAVARCRAEKEREETVRCDRQSLAQRERTPLLKPHRVSASTLASKRTKFYGRVLYDAVIDDVLHPDPSGIACGNIWGFSRPEKLSHLFDELKRAPRAVCHYLEFEQQIVAFAIYDEAPKGIDPFFVYVPRYDHETALPLPRLHSLMEASVGTSLPRVYHELIFMCSRRDPRRFGTILFETLLSHTRAKGSAVTLFAGQARHMASPTVVDHEKTDQVAQNFYKKHWSDVRVSRSKGRLTFSEKGHPLSIDCGSTDLRLWVKLITP